MMLAAWAMADWMWVWVLIVEKLLELISVSDRGRAVRWAKH